MLHALGAWVFFSVIVGLFHLWVDVAIRWIRALPVRIDSLLADGTLFFFSVPLAAGAYGECRMVKVWVRHGELDTYALILLGVIVFTSTVLYSALKSQAYQLKKEPSAPDHVSEGAPKDSSNGSIDPKLISFSSKWIAIISVIYGLLLAALRMSGS